MSASRGAENKDTEPMRLLDRSLSASRGSLFSVRSPKGRSQAVSRKMLLRDSSNGVGDRKPSSLKPDPF